MEKMVNVYLFGKRYQVPESLTIMKAMEYAGYQLVRGCGCRNGFVARARRFTVFTVSKNLRLVLLAKRK